MAIYPSGIYAIKNIATGKIYIGSAINLQDRETKHFRELREGKHHSKKLQCSWDKHGGEMFLFTTLLYCLPKDLLFFEQRAIDTFKSAVCGYNMNLTAGSRLGVKHTEATKAKISALKKGIKKPPLTDEARRHMSLAHIGKQTWCLGRKATLETRAKLRARVITDDTRKKISESLKGNKHAKGFKHSDETRAKVSLAGMGNKHTLGKKLSDETKYKIGTFSRGKRKSAETRAKMSESAKCAWVERRAI